MIDSRRVLGSHGGGGREKVVDRRRSVGLMQEHHTQGACLGERLEFTHTSRSGRKSLAWRPEGLASRFGRLFTWPTGM